MRKRRWSGALGVGLATLALSTATAVAAPTVISTPPLREAEGQHEVTFFVGGVDEVGHSMKASDLELVVDGQPMGPPAGAQSLADWSTVNSESSQTWRPPLSVGLVYLWIDGVPAGVLDGVQAFAQRIPQRTLVFPTIYGRLRQGRARLAASEIGRLQELPHVEAYRPNLIDAVRMDLGDLAADEAPLKILLLVTDGRDFADPKGEGPGDFAALGRQIREAGITPFIVAFPFPEADADEVTGHLRDLHDAAGGFLRVLERAEDLENTLESLGQAVADLQRVRMVPPWSWGALGGSHRIAVRLTAGGRHLNADIGTVVVGGGARIGLVVLFVVVGLGAALGLVMMLRRPRAGAKGGKKVSAAEDDDAASDEESVVATAHDLIRRGASPQRAVEELARLHGSSARAVIDLDPEVLSDPRFPYFRTRPGRARIKEIQDILAKKSTDRAALSSTLAGILASSIKEQTPPEQAAKMVAARLAAEEATAFAGLGLEQLAEALRSAAGGQAILGTPRARGAVVAIQDALREGGAFRGILVGWLVRAGGPGRRGETLRLTSERTVVGRGPTALVRIDDDPAIAPEHAEIVLEGGEFVLTPLAGAVRVEGTPVSGRRVLTDGESIQVGSGVYVFKAARSGRLGAA